MKAFHGTCWAAALLAALAGCSDGQRGRILPAAGPAGVERKEVPVVKTEKAMFGAGCFWGIESAFRKVEGVVDAAVGYAGGSTENPTYREVCTDQTGHAEVVQVEYDPTRVSYDQLLDVFWTIHDPTTLNRQGPDVGTQYRSVIFHYSPEQEAAAKASRAKLETSRKHRRPIVTQIMPAPAFHRAEEYHQRYLEKKGILSCPSSGH
jgi:peptide-methionine (S)-S-oxide reductase